MTYLIDQLPEGRLPLYVVYSSPKDYPGEFVCRRQVCLFDQSGNSVIAAESHLFARAPTLEQLRDQLPRHLGRIPRHTTDDPVIVESWI